MTEVFQVVVSDVAFGLTTSSQVAFNK